VIRVEQQVPRSRRRLCSLLGYSRQACYKQIKSEETATLQADLLLAEVCRMRSEQPRLGSRKLLHMLGGFMHAHGIKMGRDAFFDLLGERGMLVQRRKRRVPRTTFSSHPYYKYANLVQKFIPISANQLWVSDITYIRLREGFAYLSLITDAYSRKIVGFDLCERISAKGCIAALKMALKQNPDRSQELIHHSDRGIQYCSNNYVKLLQQNRIAISMTQSGDPRDNALAERVNGILKDELLEKRYEHYRRARLGVADAIHIYNNRRPHSSIDMLTPNVAHQHSGELKRRWKKYYFIPKTKEVIMDG
jgi:transposase InsO family protein